MSARDSLRPKAPTARGKALRRTEAELQRMSTISPTDIHAAVRLWRETAPASARGLIDAELETDA